MGNAREFSGDVRADAGQLLRAVSLRTGSSDRGEFLSRLHHKLQVVLQLFIHNHVKYFDQIHFKDSIIVDLVSYQQGT